MNKIKKVWHVLTHEGLHSFSKKLAVYYTKERKIATRALVYPYASFRLPIEANKQPSINSAVNLIFDGFRGTFAPMQIRSEISGLCEIIKKAEPKTVLEVGTSAGGSLFLFCRFSTPDATIVSIDLPKGFTGGFHLKITNSLHKKFASRLQKLTLLRKNSHKQETLELLKNIIKNKQIDFLFIDADHTYEGVKRDYELYSPLVRKGGIIGFHDIVRKSKEEVGWEGTHRFWDEVKLGKNYKEIIENPNQACMGIGVIFT